MTTPTTRAWLRTLEPSTVITSQMAAAATGFDVAAVCRSLQILSTRGELDKFAIGKNAKGYPQALYRIKQLSDEPGIPSKTYSRNQMELEREKRTMRIMDRIQTVLDNITRARLNHA
jgi:predicted ArsR family transcriptional regulator